MKIRVLGCSGGSAPGRNPSCYLLEDGVSIDAGALSSALTLEEQHALKDVFLTHAHWDHVRDLPFTIINRGPNVPALTVHGLPETIDVIRRHLMNGETWFEAFDLPSAETPYVAANAISPGETHVCGRYRISAFSVPHTIPAVSYLIDDGFASVVINADTGGGGVLRNLPAGASRIRAVFLEASFPNASREFAKLTGHLTPAMVGEEIAHLPPDVDVIVTHLKPGFETQLAREVADLGRPGVRCCRDGDVFTW